MGKDRSLCCEGQEVILDWRTAPGWWGSGLPVGVDRLRKRGNLSGGDVFLQSVHDGLNPEEVESRLECDQVIGKPVRIRVESEEYESARGTTLKRWVDDCEGR